MQVMKWSVIALAVAAGTSQLAIASEQSESAGFVEGSSFNVLTRALYFNRDFRNHNGPVVNGKEVSRAEATGLGFIGTFESGFTVGTVGVGLDGIALQGAKLDGGKGHVNRTSMFPIGDSGDAADDFSSAGVAVKARISNTTAKYGTQFVGLPVFSTDDSRLLPETANGTLITSNEIEGLTLNAAYFTALNSQTDSRFDAHALKNAKVIGGFYSFNDDLSAGLYASDLEDVFKKYYGNLNYNLTLSESQALNFDFNIYRTNYAKEYTGTGEKEHNTIWSLATAYSFGAHALTLAYQRSHGGYTNADGDVIGYDYGQDGGGTIWLSNSVQYSDFNGKDEKSWQLRYDLDFAEFGVPGLAFMTRYITGTGIDTGTTNSGKEWERDIQIGYTVQEGAAKDLNVRVRQATYRSGTKGWGNDIDEVRVIVEYPLSIL